MLINIFVLAVDCFRFLLAGRTSYRRRPWYIGTSSGIQQIQVSPPPPPPLGPPPHPPAKPVQNLSTKTNNFIWNIPFALSFPLPARGRSLPMAPKVATNKIIRATAVLAAQRYVKCAGRV